MGLRTAISARTLAFTPLPAVGRTETLRRQTGAATGTDTPPPNLDEIAARFLMVFRAGGKPQRRDWNRIAWCLWTTSPAISQDSTELAAVLDHFATSRRPRLFRQLAAVYLAEFDENRPALDQVASILRARSEDMGEPWQRLARAGVFDGAGAPARIATSALGAGLTVATQLHELGLQAKQAEMALSKAAYRSGLLELGRAKATTPIDHLAAVVSWSSGRDDQLAFADLNPIVANALVGPLLGAVVSAPDQKQLCAFLLRHFGDPRGLGERWQRVRVEVTEEVRKWLTAQTLEQFFELLGEVVDHDQWRYRAAFWKAYFRKGWIRNAQIVLARQLETHALRSFGAQSEYALFRAGGRKQIQPNHAVLVLDLGQCIVADWTHDGRCNIWPAEDATAPMIRHRRSPDQGRPDYISSEVMRVTDEQYERPLNAMGIFSHGGSANHVWQERVADRIGSFMGVRLQRSDYTI